MESGSIKRVKMEQQKPLTRTIKMQNGTNGASTAGVRVDIIKTSMMMRGADTSFHLKETPWNPKGAIQQSAGFVYKQAMKKGLSYARHPSPVRMMYSSRLGLLDYATSRVPFSDSTGTENVGMNISKEDSASSLDTLIDMADWSTIDTFLDYGEGEKSDSPLYVI